MIFGIGRSLSQFGMTATGAKMFSGRHKSDCPFLRTSS